MSYEASMLAKWQMPSRERVADVLLQVLLEHRGVIKEFNSNSEVVDELAAKCGVSDAQRSVFLETIYRKENRLKRTSLWHRLIFRAATDLANRGWVTRPTQTARISGNREWMLTEIGFDAALKASSISNSRKDELAVRSYEVQKIVKELVSITAPKDYDPVDRTKKKTRVTQETILRCRGFRQAVIEAYDFRCSLSLLRIPSPDALRREVQAAHIVPNYFRGRDDVCNGVALCHLHHWAFDVGWFTITFDYKLQVSAAWRNSSKASEETIEQLGLLKRVELEMPTRRHLLPHPNALQWHHKNVFHP